MATFQTHINDLRWLFQEKGMLHVHSWLALVAQATTQGTTPTGANAIGNLECDAATANGFAAAITNTVKPSGNLDLKNSTKLEYGSGVTPVSKEVVPASSTTR